ncbi:histidine kinase [Cavenderia fasciculata]|uniref:Histidine kinase n=1 Tax=Cavenderia fasciculata TaxID=261658 RepID=F4PUZ4_CACFS|nr:histidine kinase [Cavenderia fasciculata]EGG21110.1 histidine kinase [Cavenderia fasciculata]|eukprot:XP_004358960.1 histidine kinase [Cavenderia fasciculata]
MNMSSASWLQDFYIGEKIQEEKIFSIFTATYFSHNNLFLNQWNQPNAQLPHQPNYVSSTSSASSASSASSNSHSNGNSNNNNNNNNNNNSISLSSNINSISNNNNNNNINQQLVLKNNNNVINGINTTNNNNNNNNVFKLDQSSSPLILKQQQQFPKIKDKEKDKDKDQDQSTSLTNNPTVSTTSTSSTTSTLLSATSINLVSPRTDINNNNNNNGYIKTHIKGASSASSIPTPPSALLQPTPAIVSSNTTSTTSTTTSSKQSTSSSSSQTQPVTVGAPQTPHLAKHFSLENVNYDGVSSGGSSSSSSSLSGLSVPPITYTGASANSGTPSSASRHAEILFSNQKVLLKIINTKYPSMDLMSLFQREFAILSILNNIDGVIKVLRAQTEVGSIFAFVLEDSGFKPLTSVFSSMGPPTPTSLQGNRSTSTSTSTNNTTTTSSSSSQQSSESRESSLNNSQTRSTPNSGDTASTQSSSLSPASQSNKLPTPQSSSPIITSTTAIKFQDMDLMTFINISIQLAKILEEIHLRGCIHRDIRPSNIYISNGIVKLANFQFSVIKLSNGQTIDNSLLYLKTFPEIGRYNSTSYYYSSPEETGRTQHTVDYRSDLYSLGVTFYELLTNRLPFQTNDLSELIHAHLAKKAPFVSDLNYNVPPILSKIIDKLLKKSPDERYNSAYGLRRDLEICKSQISSNCTTDGFELGIYDVLHRPHIPTELYSRKNELNAIYQSVNRVCKGNKEFIFVSGGSGVGKTSLINAAKKKAPSGPRFIAGKFDLYNRGVPYSAIIEALNELMHMILVLSPVELAFYKEKLHRSLGPNVGVIVNVIPLLELIVGQYPPVPALPPSESQNRFDLAFKDFLRVFSEEGHPLVLFLDDLQRADEGSCRLIKLILENNNNLRHLLIIGAYREDNTAFTNTNKQHWLSLCEEISIPVTRISLKPLDLMDVNYLVASSLHKHPNETYVLSEVVLSKTHGNPFFTIQFLKTLFNENLVFFDVNCDSWKWDITNIQTRQYTDNVVEFMVSNLQQLSIESQRVMQLASCIGNIFDLDMLSVVAECTTEEILRLLTPIIAQDLILNIDDRKYRFVHDRVQQAAYSLVLQGKEKPEIHLNIGRSLYANAGGCIDKDQSTIFDIVNQYNLFDERNRTINDGDADLTVGVIDDTEQKERLEMVEHCVARLIIYASNSKQNFYVMVLLVQAELCHVHGKYIEAMELFSEAISEAQLNKYVQYEALANEMAARMYVKLTKYAVARAYLLEAQLCYRRTVLPSTNNWIDPVHQQPAAKQQAECPVPASRCI